MLTINQYHFVAGTLESNFNWVKFHNDDRFTVNYSDKPGLVLTEYLDTILLDFQYEVQNVIADSSAIIKITGIDPYAYVERLEWKRVSIGSTERHYVDFGLLNIKVVRFPIDYKYYGFINDKSTGTNQGGFTDLLEAKIAVCEAAKDKLKRILNTMGV